MKSWGDRSSTLLNRLSSILERHWVGVLSLFMTISGTMLFYTEYLVTEKVANYMMAYLVYVFYFFAAVMLPPSVGMRKFRLPRSRRLRLVLIGELLVTTFAAAITATLVFIIIAQDGTTMEVNVITQTLPLLGIYIVDWIFSIPYLQRRLNYQPQGLSLWFPVGLVLSTASVMVFRARSMSLDWTFHVDPKAFLAGFCMAFYGLMAQDMFIRFRLPFLLVMLVIITASSVLMMIALAILAPLGAIPNGGEGTEALRILLTTLVDGLLCITFSQNVNEGDECSRIWMTVALSMVANVIYTYSLFLLFERCGFALAHTLSNNTMAFWMTLVLISQRSSIDWIFVVPGVALAVLALIVLTLSGYRSRSHPRVVAGRKAFLENAAADEFELLGEEKRVPPTEEFILDDGEEESEEMERRGGANIPFKWDRVVSAATLKRAMKWGARPVRAVSHPQMTIRKLKSIPRSFLVQLLWIVLLFSMVGSTLLLYYTLNMEGFGSHGICGKWETEEACHSSGRLCGWCPGGSEHKGVLLSSSPHDVHAVFPPASEFQASEFQEPVTRGHASEKSGECVMLDCSLKESYPECHVHGAFDSRCSWLEEELNAMLLFGLAWIVIAVAYAPLLLTMLFPLSNHPLIRYVRDVGWQSVVAANLAMFMFWFMQFFFSSVADAHFARKTLLGGAVMTYEYFHALDEFEGFFSQRRPLTWRNGLIQFGVYLIVTSCSGVVLGGLEVFETVSLARSTVAALLLDVVAQIMHYHRMTCQFLFTLYILAMALVNVVMFETSMTDAADAEILHLWVSCALIILFLVQSKVLIGGVVQTEPNPHHHHDHSASDSHGDDTGHFEASFSQDNIHLHNRRGQAHAVEHALAAEIQSNPEWIVSSQDTSDPYLLEPFEVSFDIYPPNLPQPDSYSFGQEEDDESPPPENYSIQQRAG